MTVTVSVFGRKIVDEIKCPKCGCVEEDYTDFVSWWGDQSIDFECRNCGAKLTAYENVERIWHVSVREPVPVS